jgi:HJR/Mrr/RecB family endonuclease
MSTIQESAHVRQLAEQNRRISHAEAMRAGLQRQRSAANRAVFHAGVGHAYRQIQLRLRSPARSFDLWPLGVMLVGPLIPGSLTFAFVQIVFDSFGAALASFLTVTSVAATLLACLLFVPNNARREFLAESAKNQLRNSQTQADRIRVELSNIDRSIRADTQSLDAIAKSVQYKQELLLQQNWKAMRGPEWEAFLADVFHLLGGVIGPTGKSGDQGVDLIVDIGRRRYAIQAKGYVSSVGNSAVQEAVAGMAHYGCSCSAVITNSRFTAGAIALAESNCCLLIGEDQIPAFVLGHLPL